MTPKEKARELVSKYGKTFALKYSDDIIEIESNWKRNCLAGKTSIKYDKREQSILDHWLEVKREIEKL